MKCDIIEFVHMPMAEDLENGVPKHSVSSDVRICMDSRKSNCIYFKKIIDETKHFKVEINACLHGYRKE